MSVVRFVEATLVLALLVIVSVPAFPQSAVSLGTIEGTVKDTTGAVLPGASVAILNSATGFSRSTVTDGRGNFKAPLLPVGEYVMTISLSGFKTLIRERLELTIGGTVTLIDLILEVATVEETVTVTTESPVVETSRSVVSATIQDRAIHSLPIDSRDFQEFAVLTPTVIREPGRDTISMGGAKGIDTAVLVDGQDFTNTFFGSAHGQPETSQFVISQGAIREFQVMANGFSAEFGRSAGGVLNVVTKSGTNDFGGNGAFFIRNESFTSTLDLPDGTEVPKTDFSQTGFGASLGGPIVEDKAHFFVSFDRSDIEQPFVVNFDRDVSGVPSLTQLFGGPVAGVDNISSLEGTFQRLVDYTAFLGKLDFQISDSNTLTVRYNYSKFNGENFGASAGGVAGNVQSSSEGNTETTSDTAHSFVVSNTTVIGTNKFNELKFQYAFESRPRASNNDMGPDVRIDDCCRFGRLGFLPITSDHTRWQITDNFTYLFGNHDLKVGFDFNYTSTAQGFFGFSAGEWRFSTLDDFVASNPRSLFQRVGLNGFSTVESGTIDFRQVEYATYIQDNWKPKPGLTLNFGLRWEGLDNPVPPEMDFGLPATNPDNPGSVLGLEQTAFPNDYKMLSPRFGFAWDPNKDGRTVVRGGAGIFYSRTPLLLFASGLTTNGFRQALFFFYRPSPDFIQFPSILPEDGIAPDSELGMNLPASEIFFVDPEFRNPRNQRFNLGVERELGDRATVALDVIYAHSIFQQRRHNLNLNPPIGFDEVGRGLFGSDRPDPTYSRFWNEEAVGNARYTAFVFSFKKRMSNNYEFQAFYTLADNKSHDDNERDASGSRISQPENLDIDWGPSDRDVRHRVAGYFLYQIPGNVTLSTVFSFNSGRPFDVILDDDANGDGRDDADRGVVDDSNRALVQGAGQDLPDGLQERNSARQPAFYNIDIRAQQSFALGGRGGQIDVIFEVFNLLNNPNRSTTRNRITSSTFGVLNQIALPRQAQIGVRYQF